MKTLIVLGVVHNKKAFRCRTCDKDKILLYCETCWRRDHQRHECEEFFYPVRCATKTKTN